MSSWIDRYRAVLWKQGVYVTDEGELVRLEGLGTEPPRQEVLDFLNGKQEDHRIESRQLRNWVSDLAHVTTRIGAGDSTDPTALESVFWIRLAGVLIEIPKKYRKAVELFGKHSPHPKSDLGLMFALFAAIEALRARFDEDELLWIEYRRHVDAHVLQSAYSPQWAKSKDAPTSERLSQILGRSLSLAEWDAKLDRVFRRYLSEPAMAKDFARRALDSILEVEQAVLRVT
jgi:hypothetical protein